MKCPKCGYLGFETTDRCRNCQYDFSLAPLTADPELALQPTERDGEGPDAFELPSLRRPTDTLTPGKLDLDRLFGSEPDAPGATDATTIPDDQPDDQDLATSRPQKEPPSELPFDDTPIVPPPAARPPLAVRRATNEVPRNRPRTTRPPKPESLRFEPETTPGDSTADTVAPLIETPPLRARVGAGAIDAALLVALDASILYLTLRVSGLSNTVDDVRVLPPIPFVGFLALLAFGYAAAFTVAGGQTIGKMLMSVRVIGDDGRPLDAAGGMLRAAGWMLVPLTLGLSYVPVLVTSDHRALHDRLAGTRVVRE